MAKLSGLFQEIVKRPQKKIFCIGRNKTGTTSLAKALTQLGFKVADQRQGELMLEDWSRRDYKTIIDFCRHSGDAFQDIPFSLPFTFQALDIAFPRSKFILTIRDNPEQWYNSITSYHSLLFGNGKIPSADDLRSEKYVHEGWMWLNNRLIYNTPEDDIYNKELMIKHYNYHNEMVTDYFRHRKNDLLILNLAHPAAYKQLCEFLEIKNTDAKLFPWENRTNNL